MAGGIELDLVFFGDFKTLTILAAEQGVRLLIADELLGLWIELQGAAELVIRLGQIHADRVAVGFDRLMALSNSPSIYLNNIHIVNEELGI